MRPKPVLFLDDGGVMNDNAVRGPQWAALLGPFMSERYGGDPAEWSRVNRDAFDAAWAHVVGRLRTYTTHREMHRDYSVRWTEAMFAAVGRTPPPDDECVRLVEESSIFVLRQVRSDVPGAVEAIRELRSAGFTLHTASGTISGQLDAILAAMGVRDCFGPRLYGPDLVDIPKGGPEYYRRIFEDAGVDPAQAIVVDDSADSRSWAASLGARALQVGSEGDVPSLAALTRTLLDA